MSDTSILIAFIILFGVPAVLISLPFIWYGKRHNWDKWHYALVEIGVGIGWFVVFALWVLKGPIHRVLMIAVLAGGASLVGAVIGRRVSRRT